MRFAQGMVLVDGGGDGDTRSDGSDSGGAGVGTRRQCKPMHVVSLRPLCGGGWGWHVEAVVVVVVAVVVVALCGGGGCVLSSGGCGGESKPPLEKGIVEHDQVDAVRAT